jgi:hypothetical protein
MYCDWWTYHDARHKKEFKMARDALQCMSKVAWWEWKDGSRPVHWKWLPWYQPTIQFGLPVWLRELPTQWRQAQPDDKTPQEHVRIVDKLDTVQKRRYNLEPGEAVFSLTSFIAIPKGENDIRMINDGTQSGLNENIWVPQFPLLMVNTHLRVVSLTTWMSNMDTREMFFKFIIHVSMQVLAVCAIQLNGQTDKVIQTVRIIQTVAIPQ